LREKRKAAAERAGLTTPRGALTCDDYFDKVIAARALDGKATSHAKSRWRAWIAPHIGKLPIATIPRAKVEDVRDALDAKVRERLAKGKREGLSGKSAMNVWSVLRSVLSESVSSRDRSLRVRADDPSAGIKPPLTSPARRKTFIYPNEAAKLLACADVPREWRELYAIALYTALRPGELRALTWSSDVDLSAGVIRVSKAFDDASGKVKAPKTRNGIRTVPIEPSLLPLLQRMHDEKTGDRVLPIMAAEDLFERARTFRRHLALANIDRARITADDDREMMVNFRSCRDSGITWWALAGLDVLKLQRRAGHDSLSTTGGYVKIAEDVGGNFGTPFAPLPAALTSAAPAGSFGSSSGQVAVVYDETLVFAAENERPQGDSNPC
jgi:integrase